MEIQELERQSTPVLELTTYPALEQPFISAILFLKDMLKNIVENIDDSSDLSVETDSFSPNLDTLHFGMFSNQIERLKEQNLLLPEIKKRRIELLEQKEHWRPFVDSLQGQDREFYSLVETILHEGKLIPAPTGKGSAYFVVDPENTPRFVIKPVDEDIFCINHPKELGSPFNDSEHHLRDNIPLYRSAQIDAFCWEVALLSGIRDATPRAMMGIISDERFYDASECLSVNIKDAFIRETGMPDKEKLCSVQEYIPHSQDLLELLHEFYAENLSDEEIGSRFDTDDFEQVCLFLWLTYDNDAHGSNFRAYIKRINETGKKIYGIKKIDNGLSFPEKNTQYINILTWMPNALAPISEKLKQKIGSLPIVEILMRMESYELFSCEEAFQERIEILKTLSQTEGITIGEIDLRMTLLSREGGKEVALEPMTTEEILHRLLGTINRTGKTASEGIK
jgi:hypothetical protein